MVVIGVCLSHPREGFGPRRPLKEEGGSSEVDVKKGDSDLGGAQGGELSLA